MTELYRKKQDQLQTTINASKMDDFVPVHVRASSGSYNFSVGSFSQVGWSNVLLDDFGAMSSGIFTVPEGKNGFYRLRAQITINDSGVGFASYIEGQFTVNATGDQGTSSSLPRGLHGWGTGDQYPELIVNGTVYLNAGDQVRFLGYQNAGPSRAVLTDNRSSLDIYQLTQD